MPLGQRGGVASPFGEARAPGFLDAFAFGFMAVAPLRLAFAGRHDSRYVGTLHVSCGRGGASFSSWALRSQRAWSSRQVAVSAVGEVINSASIVAARC